MSPSSSVPNFTRRLGRISEDTPSEALAARLHQLMRLLHDRRDDSNFEDVVRAAADYHADVMHTLSARGGISTFERTQVAETATRYANAVLQGRDEVKVKAIRRKYHRQVERHTGVSEDAAIARFE